MNNEVQLLFFYNNSSIIITFCRCAVDRLQTDNGSLVILCTDASGRNTSAGRILEIAKGKDYGES